MIPVDQLCKSAVISAGDPGWSRSVEDLALVEALVRRDRAARMYTDSVIPRCLARPPKRVCDAARAACVGRYVVSATLLM